MMLQAQDNVAIKELVSRLDLESYKSVIKGLTQFGDSVKVPAEIKKLSTGLSNNFKPLVAPTRNVSYTYDPEPRPPRRRQSASERTDLKTPTGGNVGRNGSGPGGSSIFGYRSQTGVNRDLMAQPDERIRTQSRGTNEWSSNRGLLHENWNNSTS